MRNLKRRIEAVEEAAQSRDAGCRLVVRLDDESEAEALARAGLTSQKDGARFQQVAFLSPTDARL
jgi:hypothetical protein